MDKPELSEEQLVRARKLVGALDEGAAQFGLHPKQAKIGVTDEGETVIIMDFSIGPEAFSDE